ncbi:MAG: MarR family transcriptional regulator [Phycisphaerales bacterium]|nr:MarR family transcriptional regulator [Phycisphaerales bacterium]
MACRITKPKDPAAAARAEVVELLFVYVDRLKQHFDDLAETHGLTSVQAKVIMSLDDPEPMRSVAECLGCDPSNITGVIDRLQERGLVTRVEDAHDRRVKRITATAAGRKLREAFETDLFRNVPGMKTLTNAQIADLRDALASLARPEPKLSERPEPRASARAAG